MPKGFTFPKQSGAQKQRVGGYVVAAKGQTLVIHKAPQDKAETGADGKAGTAEKEETAAVAFFRAASEIKAFDVYGVNIAVGCGVRRGAADASVTPCHERDVSAFIPSTCPGPHFRRPPLCVAF